MRCELPFLTPITAQLLKRRFESIVQIAKLLAALAHAGPNNPGPARVRKATHSFQAQGKRTLPAADLCDRPANPDQVALADLAQEEQRYVQIVRFDPFNLSARGGKFLLQSNGTIAQCILQTDPNECA